VDFEFENVKGKNMKKTAYVFTILFYAASLSGCAHAPSPVTGFIYTNVIAAKGPVNPHAGHDKVGSAACTSILGFIGTGNCSIEAAVKNGNITKIHHVTHHSRSYVGLYARFEIIVYGE
jgi:hypothetical protein